MQRRRYGRTEHELSIVGMGGIVVMGASQQQADRVVHDAIDRGVNYFDVAPSYGDAQDRLGPALEGFRDNVFLACKTAERTRAEASAELHQSLRKLRTDHFDLYQLHGLASVQEAETCFGPGGAMEAVLDAREQGLVRHIGFSAHSVDAAMLAMDQLDFDSVLIPVSCTTWYGSGFGPQILEKARAKGVAVLALKAMAWRPWPEGVEHADSKCWYEPFADPRDAELALRWTLSQPVVAAIPPGEEALFRLAMDIADRFQPLSEEEEKEVKRRFAGIAPLFSVEG